MTGRWIGALCVIAGCGCCGLTAAGASRREVRLLRQLDRTLCFMESALTYRLTPLPQLCREAAAVGGSTLRRVLLELAGELECRISPDAPSCMAAVLDREQALPKRVRRLLRQLGSCLGSFDLTGQLKELALVRSACSRELETWALEQPLRQRSYRTLGLCTGAALAILLL